jgi:riboflavin synthase
LSADGVEFDDRRMYESRFTSHGIHMFTGIIEGVGSVRTVRRRGSGAIIEIACDFDLERTNVGESIAVNGVCLTVTSRLGKSFWADLSEETLHATTLGLLKEGDPVNLERALTVGARLGGHIVQGHVDGMCEVAEVTRSAASIEIVFAVPHALSRYIVARGSVAVDGVSLTVTRCYDDRFSVTIIPHTKLRTTFSQLAVGDKVNLEVDIIGKYVERLGFLDSEQYGDKDSKITEEFLKKHGF